MKTYEERYQAWLEDRMTPVEAEAFEQELENQPLTSEQQAELEQDLPIMAQLLQAHTPTPPMPNMEFFNQRVLEDIAADPGSRPELRTASPGLFSRIRELLRVPQVALASMACALLLVTVFGVTQFSSTPVAGEYYVHFHNVDEKNQNISATPVETAGAQVLWINGLDWIEDSQDVVRRVEKI